MARVDAQVRQSDRLEVKITWRWEPANDYVHSREEIEKSFAAGNITKGEAERLIRLRYKLNLKGERVIEDRERDYD